MWERIGTTVMRRHLFDLTNGWEGTPPAGDHIVVVTHRPRPEGWHPEASCQALALGLLDVVAMDVVPVVFGRGKRFFGAIDAQQLEDSEVVIQGRRMIHLRYRVRR